MEADLSAQIGADRFERSVKRTSRRNGYRPRLWEIRVGTLAALR